MFFTFLNFRLVMCSKLCVRSTRTMDLSAVDVDVLVVELLSSLGTRGISKEKWLDVIDIVRPAEG